MKIFVVCGLGFGDEGKGSMVNYLCKNSKKPLVVRHSSGHQVGHTVVIGDKRHVFSNFGSGSLIGVPTYYSEYCTVDPVGVFNEYLALDKIGVKPINFYHPNAMITTPFDKYANVSSHENIAHGTVGVGFGKTIERNENHFRLYVRDLFYPQIRDIKIKNITEYYRNSFNSKVIDHISGNTLNTFINHCNNLTSLFKMVEFGDLYRKFNDIIFEGNQGIMLDAEYGFFPHVTRCSTTSKNAMEIINNHKLFNDFQFEELYTFYVTRAYQTRHGNGQMTNAELDTSYIKDNPHETNISAGHQGIFRKSVLDADMLEYAISCDRLYNKHGRKILIVTCLDQVPEKFPVTINRTVENIDYMELAANLNMLTAFPSYSDEGPKIDF